MNVKQLLLLTALLMPGSSSASRLGDALLWRGKPTRKQEKRVWKNPTSPNLDPVAVGRTWNDDLLITIYEQNPNIELQAVAANALGTIFGSDAAFSFDGIRKYLPTTKKYFHEARVRLKKLEQTPEIKAILKELKGYIMSFEGCRAQSVEECQMLIDMVTDLGYTVKETAQEIYEKYYEDSGAGN